VATGAAISVASTMVVAKLLAERGELHAPHAHLAIATLLMEDLIIVALIVILPVLAGETAERARALGIGLARAAIVLLPFFYLANRVVPQVMARVARRGNPEMFILVAMAIGVGTAALSSSLGLSLALGAFLGGLIISESEFTHEVLARILPMRDLFGALFFVSVGTLIRPTGLAAGGLVLLVLLLLIIPGKFVVRTVVLRLFRYPWSMAGLVSLHLSQTGEFTFVLAQVARGAGLIPDSVYQAILAASLLSILVTAGLSRAGHRWIEAPQRMEATGLQEIERVPSRVLICGFGRVGGTIGDALEAFDIPYTVVDLDFTVIETLRMRGIPCVYGDVASEPVLRTAGAGSARLAVLATPDFERTRLAARRLREINPSLPIMARSMHALQRTALIEAGATEVIQPEFEAAQTLLRHGLERLGVPHEEIKTYMLRQEHVLAHAELPEDTPSLELLQTRTITVGPGFCADTSLRDAAVRERTGVSVLAVRGRDGVEVLNPNPDTVLRVGDKLTVIGMPDQIALFERLNGRPHHRREPPAR
jgi:CPA2 family monovalent cation:H+ antiporter-2